ncbi:MAG: hypothetical protein ACLSUR_17060 [Coprobacillus cateniformis]
MNKVVAFQKALFRCQLRGILNGGWIMLMFLPSMLGLFGLIISFLMFFIFLDSIIRNHDSLKLFPISKKFYVLNIFLSGILFLFTIFLIYICLVAIVVFIFNLLQSQPQQGPIKDFVEDISVLDIKRNVSMVMVFIFTYFIGITTLLKVKKEASCVIAIILLSIFASILIMGAYKQADVFIMPMIILGLCTMIVGPLWCMKREKRLC